jgi:hypothetical protein
VKGSLSLAAAGKLRGRKPKLTPARKALLVDCTRPARRARFFKAVGTS